MTTSIELENFLSEGMSCYADARQAVDEFERVIQDRLIAILDAKRDWRNFKGQYGARGRGKAFSVGTWNDAGGCGIWVSQLAEDAADGWIDLGLWWRSQKAPDGVIAFCGRWDVGYKIRKLAADPKPPVEYGSIGQRPRFFVVVDRNAGRDLHGHANLLLDELDRALGPG